MLRSFLLVATNPAGAAQASASVVVESAPGPTLPAWLVGVPVNEWCAIPGTELTASAIPEQIAAGLATGAYGDPRDGIMDYSGGALKKSGSEMLIFGGGGAGAWAGNDVRGLRLEDDAPRWRTLVKPTNAAQVPPRTVPGMPGAQRNDNLDGTPVARHSYWEPQFIDATDTFMAFGTEAVWMTDMGIYHDVKSVPFSTGVWNAPTTHPNIPATPGVVGFTYGGMRCKHPVTENVYAANTTTLFKFDRIANTWSVVITYPGSVLNNAYGAIDPTRNILVRANAVNGKPSTIDLGTSPVTYREAVFSGPHAASVIVGNTVGFVYDAGIDKFVMFKDDGFLYTYTYVSHAEYHVDRLPLTGAPPAIGGSGLHVGSPGSSRAIWGRMQYVPNLKGICIVQASNKPAYFVRTS